jgi:hypothetical protein
LVKEPVSMRVDPVGKHSVSASPSTARRATCLDFREP